MSVLQMSLSAAGMVVIIAILRALAAGKLPQKTFVALWLAALGRLLLPVSIEHRYSFLSLVGHIKGLFRGQATPQPGAFAGALPPGGGAGGFAGAAASPVSPLVAVWLVGAALCALALLVPYVRCRREFRTSLPLHNAFVTRWQAETKIRRPLCVRVSDKISAPLTYGVLRPVILLPKTTNWDNQEQLRHILIHEHTHIRHWDALLKLCMGAALCAHWFNPLVWVMFILFNRDMELFCDESVVKKLGPGSKAAYALTLIQMEEQTAPPTPLYSSFSKYAIEERVNTIMKYKKSSIAAIAAAVVLVVATTTVFGASAANAEPQTTSAEAQTTPQNEAQVAQTPSAEYLLHGITYNENGKMLYNNKLVRFFFDGVAIDEDSFATRYECFNADGVVDVHTVYRPTYNGDGSHDPFGELIGVAEYTQAEFDARDVDAFTNPTATPQATAVGGTAYHDTSETQGVPTNTAVYEGTGDEGGGRTFAQIFAQYKAFGIAYEEPTNGGLGNVYYNGQLVKHFVDEGRGGVFSFSSTHGGGISVRAVYGTDGTLAGVEPY